MLCVCVCVVCVCVHVYVCLLKLCGKPAGKKGNMAKFSRGLQIDFVKQPRTRKSLTNPPSDVSCTKCPFHQQ